MKRIITVSLILCLVLSVCGCKKAAEEDSAAPHDIIQNGQSEAGQEMPDINLQKKPDFPTANAEDDKQTLTLDSIYSEYEVLVTLTQSESAEQKKYTVSDFDYLNLSYIYTLGNYTDHFSETAQVAQKYNDKTTLVLFLAEGGSQNILSAIEKLTQDERVFLAEPCALELGKTHGAQLEVNTKPEFTDALLNGLENKPKYELSFTNRVTYGARSALLSIKNDNVADVIAVARHLENVRDKVRIKLKYPYYSDRIILRLTDAQSAKQSEYSKQDFGLLKLSEIKKIHTGLQDGKKQIYLSLRPCDTDPYTLRKYERILSADSRVDFVFIASENVYDSLVAVKESGYNVSADEKAIVSEVSENENFAGNLIIVYIKRGYSAVQQKYQAADFPYIDVDSIETVFEYHPGEKNRVGLFLRIKQTDKKSVCEAVRLLQKDERVYLAVPNYECVGSPIID